MQIEVKVIKGKCQGGVHKIGEDTFTVDWATPEGVCLGAWNALSPCVIALLCGGNFPWEQKAGHTTIHCPNPTGITFELKRIDA